MKTKVKFTLLIVFVFFTSGCSIDSNNDTTTTQDLQTQENIVLPTTFSPNDGRVLASSCFGCHGTNGVSVNSWDSIAGEDELAHEMYEDDNLLMKSVADGYNSSEVVLMEDYLSSLSKTSDSEQEDNEKDSD